MTPLQDKILEILPKEYEEPFIGHECGCGNPIYCGHRSQCLEEIKALIPKIIEVIREDYVKELFTGEVFKNGVIGHGDNLSE